MMTKFFWQVLRFMAMWEIVKRLIDHAERMIMFLWHVSDQNEARED